MNIAVKELVPVTLSVAIWGHTWHKQKIVFKSDNMAVVIALNKRSAKDPRLAHLLRCLFFFEAHFGFEHEAQHIPGINNTRLMRYPAVISRFHSLFPTSTGPHRAGRITFTLFYGKYRANNIRDVHICKETVQRILQANRCSLDARSATHGCSFYLILSSVGTPFDFYTNVYGCHLTHAH